LLSKLLRTAKRLTSFSQAILKNALYRKGECGEGFFEVKINGI